MGPFNLIRNQFYVESYIYLFNKQKCVHTPEVNFQVSFQVTIHYASLIQGLLPTWNLSGQAGCLKDSRDLSVSVQLITASP